MTIIMKKKCTACKVKCIDGQLCLISVNLETHKGKRVIWIQNQIRLTLSAREIFCRLLITFANSLAPDQAQHNAGPDPDPNCLTLMVFLMSFFFKKYNFEKNIGRRQNQAKLSSMQRVKSGRISKGNVLRCLSD